MSDNAQAKKIALRKIFGINSPSEVLPDWSRKHGIFIHPNAKIGVSIPGMGHGISVAAGPILKGSTVVGCPRTIAIEPTKTDDPFSPAVQAIHNLPHGTATDFERVALLLFAEVCRRQKSPWFPYFSSWDLVDGGLNRLISADGDFPAPLSSLSHTDVGQCLAEQNLRRLWKRLSPVVQSMPDTFPQPLGGSFEVFSECVLQIRSRNFHVEHQKREGPFLLPCIDLINHAPQAKEEEDQSTGNTANVSFQLHGGGKKQATFDVVASRTILPGEQIFYDYGTIPRARFVSEFQFLPVSLSVPSSGTVYQGGDAIRFSPSQLQHVMRSVIAQHPPEDALHRVKVLTGEGLIFEEGLYVLFRGDSVVDSALFTVVFLLTISQKQFAELRGTISRSWEATVDASLTANVHKLLSWRLECCESSLKGLPSALLSSATNENLKGVLETELNRLKGALTTL